MNKRFVLIKSLVSNILCKGVVIGQEKGRILSDELNKLSNFYADKIQTIIEEK